MDDRRLTRGAWLNLALALLPVLMAAVSVIGLLALPTDGWEASDVGNLDAGRLLYRRNVLGTLSPLRAGDVLLAINDVPVRQIAPGTFPPNTWRAGAVLHYSVKREGQTLGLEVPLRHWDVARWALGYALQPVQVGAVLGWLALFSVSLLTFFRRPGNSAAQALLMLAGGISFLSLGGLIPGQLWLTAVSFDPLWHALFFIVITLLFSVIYPPGVLRLALVFPQPKLSLLRRPWLEYGPHLFGLLVILPAFLANLTVAGYVWVIAALLAAMGGLIHSAFTLRDAVSRAQLGWGIGGAVAGLGLVALNYVGLVGAAPSWLKWLLAALSGQGFTVFGLCLCIAILRYRLFDINVIIRRTLIYSVLTGLLALAYFGSVVVLENLSRAVTGQGQNQFATVTSTLAIAALFVPLRSRVQAFIDRRFFRRKYDAARTLAAFGAALRDEVDLARLSDHLQGVVQETMQPENVSLWLRPSPSGLAGRPAAYGREQL